MKLVWTDPAIDDLENIRDYIGRDSRYFANQFVEHIILSVEDLQNFPYMGRQCPEAEKDNIRDLIYQNYRIIY